MPKQPGAPAKEKDPETVAIGLRLRGIMEEWQFSTVDDFASALGEERNRVSNWLNGINPPPLAMAKKIKEKFPAVTLDWIYCGSTETLQSWISARLVARFRGDDVPPARIDPSLPYGAIIPPTSEPTDRTAPSKEMGRTMEPEKKRQTSIRGAGAHVHEAD